MIKNSKKMQNHKGGLICRANFMFTAKPVFKHVLFCIFSYSEISFFELSKCFQRYISDIIAKPSTIH